MSEGYPAGWRTGRNWLTIKTGKNTGSRPSVASLYRALAEAEQAAADDDLARLRPKPARVWPNDQPEAPAATNLEKLSRA